MNGNKLKKLREKHGLLQKELASNLSISTSTIGMYEQNRREPDNQTLKKIANYFNVSTDYLLDNENNKYLNELELMENEILQKELIKIGYMKVGENLTKEELDKLLEFIKINKKYIKELK